MSKVCNTSKGDAKAVSGNDPSIPMEISTSVEMRRRLVCKDTEPTCKADFTLLSGKTDKPPS
eukprot:3168596-Amphidinium_carterae.1